VFVKVQDHFKKQFVEATQSFESEKAFFKPLAEEDLDRADLLIGDLSYLKSQTKVSASKILMASEDSVSGHQLIQALKGSEFYVIEADKTQQLAELLNSLKMKVEKNQQVASIKLEIQKKRKELEHLNQQLSSESEKKIQSLQKSHVEETEKNQNEKSLLHFLDFIQSESSGDDFIEKIFRFIWKDLKRNGRLNLIGLSMTTTSGKAKILFYDGFEEASTVAQINFSDEHVAGQLATAWGRPVGKVISWVLPESSRESFLFLEIVDRQLDIEKINSYFNERIAVISMYLDRWMIEKETEVVVDRWQNTFKSFSSFTHVVDENFQVYQSNYPHEKGSFCYKVLAGRESPCESCPIIKNKSTSFTLRDDMSVKTYFSQFKFQAKKYFFVIYEDVTKLNLLHSHIIQTEKMSTLGRLGNHLAHELNNPLTGIKSYLQTLLSDTDTMSNLPTTGASDLNEILKATVRCQRIIKNFIDFSQKKEPSLEKVEFQDVLQNTLVLLKTALRSHRLFIDLKDDQVIANSHDLQQVLFNLIKNSCQAMADKGTVKIYQEVRGDKIYFQIEDTGPGFNEAILKNIFQPFMTTKDQGEGTGLGLYLSKKLMNNMNADLQITSSSQKGAKISLIFDRL
jgi:two-component system, NtrC family, sensor kinase